MDDPKATHPIISAIELASSLPSFFGLSASTTQPLQQPIDLITVIVF
jgi:hypothetical protein